MKRRGTMVHHTMKRRGTMVPPLATITKLLVLCLTAARASAKQVFCPIISSVNKDATIQSRDSTKSFNEISGLAVSPSQIAPSGEPVLFGINDTGGGQRIGVFDSGTGERLMTLRIRSSVATNKDWESLTIGSCGATDEEKTCLYIADAGDNKARTTSGELSGRNSRYRLIKIEEPLLEDYEDNDMIPDSTISVLNFMYQSLSSPTSRADCEAVFLDHVGWGEGGAIGDLYLVTKWDLADAATKTRLFKFPASVWINKPQMYMPEAVGSYDGGGSLMGYTWTGAESSFDGTLVSLVGYTTFQSKTTNFLFLRCPGSTMAEALAAPNGATQHCLEWRSPTRGQLESFAWHPDGTKTYNIAEGFNEDIGITTFKYDTEMAAQTCPQVAWIQGVSGIFCETVTDGIKKPGAWCEAAFPDSTVETEDDPLDTLQGMPDLKPEQEEEEEKPEDTMQPSKAPEVTTQPSKAPKEPEKDEEEEKPHDTLQPPKTPEEEPEDPQVELSEVTTSAAEQSIAPQITFVFIVAGMFSNLVWFAL